MFEQAQLSPDGRVEIRCCGCGYGAVVARRPQRCPMCGHTNWRGQSADGDGSRPTNKSRETERMMKRSELGFTGDRR
jgi:hypothetical protein